MNRRGGSALDRLQPNAVCARLVDAAGQIVVHLVVLQRIKPIGG
jgi:hypothetical protein